MHTPQEALDELDHAVSHLGMKVVMMASLIRRPIGDGQSRHAVWPELLGIDSEASYDPVWARCLELKVAPTFHSGTQGIGTRVSISNFVYNHLGHFAAAGEAICKALFLEAG